MFTQGTPLAAILTGGFSIALVFALFVLPFAQLAVGLGLGILLLAVATGIHDTWWVQRGTKRVAATKQVNTQPAPLQKAA